MEKDLKTISAKSSNNTMIKAGELVDIIEVSPLTVTDRKVYNLLIDNAHPNLIDPREHSIKKTVIRFSRRSDDRVDETIEKLMGAIAKIKTMRDGEATITRVPLLGRNEEHERKDGNFYYTFDPLLREVLSNSTTFARLKKDVMLNFKGKYGLAAYEMGEKRINMQKRFEDFTVEELRGYLGVPKNAYVTWNNFKANVLEKAEKEVNQLSIHFGIRYEGLKEGRAFTKVRMHWWRKSPDGEDEAIREIGNSSIGRKARRDGTVENILSVKSEQKLAPLLSEEVIAKATRIIRDNKNGFEIFDVIDDWELSHRGKEKPVDPDQDFLSFCYRFLSVTKNYDVNLENPSTNTENRSNRLLEALDNKLKFPYPEEEKF